MAKCLVPESEAKDRNKSNAPCIRLEFEESNPDKPKKINPLSSENLWSFIAGNGVYSGIRVTFREMHGHSRSLSSMRKNKWNI